MNTQSFNDSSPIDLDKCNIGLQHIIVYGIPNTEMRLNKIEEAIKLIQDDNSTALLNKFLGVKNYASFGDQDCDCNYGYGPKHGSIVFSIRRTIESIDSKAKIPHEAIYLLECVRDVGLIKYQDDNKEKYNLCDILLRLNSLKKEEMKIRDILKNHNVYYHDFYTIS